MSTDVIGALSIVAVFLLLALKVPVAFALIFVGFSGYCLITSFNTAVKTVSMILYSTVANYSFTVIPLFILMGHFAYHAGFVNKLFVCAKNFLSGIPGGLPQATVIAGAGFGAASGSGIASTTLLAKLAGPEMIRIGIDRRLVYGTVSSAGPIAQMIPPSILMVIFAMITEQSVAKLLIGGIFPGLLITICYCTMIYFRVRFNPKLAPMPTKKVPLKEALKSVKELWGILIIAIIVIGGIYAGIFTPTESGGVGAISTLILGLVTRNIKWKEIKESLIESAKTSGMIFLIIVSGFVYGGFLGISRVPTNLSEFIVSLNVAPMVTMIGIVFLYFILGFFIDMIPAMFITLPILFPVVVKLGFDPIWFGVVIVFLCEVALVTPPYGISLFLVKGILNADMNEVIQGVFPFIIIDLIILVLLISFPQIILFLPGKMGG